MDLHCLDMHTCPNIFCQYSMYKNAWNKMETPGPGCSKLTTSVVNVSLKFQLLIPYIC